MNIIQPSAGTGAILAELRLRKRLRENDKADTERAKRAGIKMPSRQVRRFVQRKGTLSHRTKLQP